MLSPTGSASLGDIPAGKEYHMIQFKDLDKSRAFHDLAALPVPSVNAILDAERVASCDIPLGSGLVYNYAASPVNGAVLASLAALASEQQLVAKFRCLAEGEIMNTGEGRMVLHHLARGQLGAPVLVENRDMRAFYESQRLKAAQFADAVHSGTIVGSSGMRFRTAIQIGIGGSDLGPRAIYLALERRARSEGRLRMEARFISNVDPDDADSVLGKLELASSIFILVSKSGTTQETLANESLVRARLEAAGLDPARHMVAVTSETSPLAGNPAYRDVFFMDDYIGGRYSSTSAVGGVILSLAFGGSMFEEFLDGAAIADRAAMEEDITKNAALLDAMIGVYERNILGMGCTAVLPYAEALSRFPAHLQQLDMESNGKRVNRSGNPIGYSTGPVVFGEPGTNGQHSFYQLLHQGSDIVPLQFIGFRKNQLSPDIEVEGSTGRAKLCANLAAQIVAFARGKDDTNLNKKFPGGRPSTLIRGEELGARELGALLAFYENKVMFQGFAWNINSFDQEGVQLGKLLARKVLAGAKDDPVLAAYAVLLLPSGNME